MSIIKFFSKQRVFTATIFIAVLVVVCIIGGWLWTLFLLVLILVGIGEFIKLLNVKEIYPSRMLISFFSVLLILLAALNKPEYFIHIVVLGFLSTFVFFLFRKKTPSVADIFSTFFGICYAGLLPVYFILIRNISSGTDNSILDPGAGFLLLTLLTICASDIGAYYSGRKLGKKPLYLSISPNKTVEGAIGGSLSGVIRWFL